MENQIKYFCKGSRIALRALEVKDVEGNYLYWLNNELVCQYNSHHRFPVTQQEILEYVVTSAEKKDIMVMAVELMKEKIHIGNISLQEINYIDRTAEVAFLFGESNYWCKGYAYEAALLFLNHAFAELNLRRLYIGTAEDNIAMQKLAEKLGFKIEGRRRKAIFKHGTYKDILEYGLLIEEFEEMKVERK